MGIPDEFQPHIATIYKMYELFAADYAGLHLLEILPSSDFSSDNDVFGDQLVAPTLRMLNSAADHMDMLREQTNRPDSNDSQWHVTGPWTLLRSALEQASVALWAAYSDDQDVRIERYLRLYQDNANQAIKVDVLRYRAKDQVRASSSSKKQLASELARLYTIRQTGDSAKARIVERINIVECVREAAEVVGCTSPVNAERMWRLASGFAHGMDWAGRTAGLTFSQEGDDGEHLWYSGLHLESFSWMVSLTIATIAHAYRVCATRCGSPVPPDSTRPMIRLDSDRPRRFDPSTTKQ